MALITIPSNTDLCAWLAQLTVSDIVFATSAGDYCSEDLCGLGASIRAEPENANGGYLMAVIDPDDDCLKWMAQPAAPVYDSTLIKPLMLTKQTTHPCPSAGNVRIDYCKLDLLTADFPVAMKLLVTWTALARDGVGPVPYFRWKPKGVVANVNAAMLADYIRTADCPPNPEWTSGQYTALLDIPANPSGLYLAFDYIEFSSGGATPIQIKIDAIAFKA